VEIEHFGIYARDTRTLADWYCNTLGFSVVRILEREGRPPIYFLAAEKGGEIEILPTKKSQLRREINDAGFSHIGLVVEDFERTIRDLNQRGISIKDIRQTSNGWQIGYFQDLEGNLLEILCRQQS
jgi:catechol 2,3-dioxygenase-like lactoylglutathione lyase family enzyme